MLSEESNKRREALKEAAKPLIEFINEYGHPHVRVIVDCDTAEMLEGIVSIKDDSFVRD